MHPLELENVLGNEQRVEVHLDEEAIHELNGLQNQHHNAQVHVPGETHSLGAEGYYLEAPDKKKNQGGYVGGDGDEDGEETVEHLEFRIGLHVPGEVEGEIDEEGPVYEHEVFVD